MVLALGCVALAGLALAGAALAGAFRGAVEETSLVTAAGHRIAASIYRPERARPDVAVVLCHGISASRRVMDPMARALARRGLLVVSFDYGGHGASEPRPGREDLNVLDVEAAVGLARRTLDPDGAKPPARVALVGHSMGVTSAVTVALGDPHVAGLVALGQRPFVTLERPRFLLVGAGAMDVFHPYGRLLGVVREAAGRPLPAFETAVDPATGSVRRLALSGGCEHAGEVFDGALLGEAAALIEASLGSGAPPAAPRAELRAPLSVWLLVLGRAAAGLALALLGLALGARLGSDLPRRRRVAAALLAVAVGVLLLARATGAASLAGVVPALLLGGLVANALLLRGAKDRPLDGRAVARVAGVLLAGWLGGTALGAAPALLDHPHLLGELPLYLWQGVAFRLQFTSDVLATRLSQGSPLTAAAGLALLAAIELARPGLLTLRVAGFSARVVSALGGGPPGPAAEAAPPEPAPATPSPAPSRQRWPQVAALVALALVAGGLFARRAGEGLLEGDAPATVAAAGLRLLVLPLAAMLIATATIRAARAWHPPTA